MNSKRLVVFAASLQWADAVKVMSRGTPRSQTSVTWGIRWSVSAAENDGESGWRFPTVRHAHLLGLIGRSHFPAQAQAEESEDRRRFDWGRGNTIFTSSAKRKAESPRAVGRSFIFNRISNGPMTERWGMPLRQGDSSERTPSIDAGSLYLGEQEPMVNGVECLCEVEVD